ncbi:DUF397 domain-containing protein [Actinomadura rayongensis]|uniref:DUF397 domain-containing protein n=1 Tax=Actinomadura rayongensis TaxID=1429076 RepID=A0A6I4W9Y9_9ACTN|nr:DUF397 domain-containing protein [Actinomadura rayongensis]MXQ64866.1 DUF397 domain-containing protein [Actinomadura rayongensis]
MQTPENRGRPVFRKTSYSSSSNNNCVEVAAEHGRLLLRDSKDPGAGVVGLDLPAARRLLARLRD